MKKLFILLLLPLWCFGQRTQDYLPAGTVSYPNSTYILNYNDTLARAVFSVFGSGKSSRMPTYRDMINYVATHTNNSGAYQPLENQRLSTTYSPTFANLSSNTYKVNGGTANQFLKADGTLDNSIYLTNNQSITFFPNSSGDVTSASVASASSLNPILNVQKINGNPVSYYDVTSSIQGQLNNVPQTGFSSVIFKTNDANKLTKSGFIFLDSLANANVNVPWYSLSTNIFHITNNGSGTTQRGADIAVSNDFSSDGKQNAKYAARSLYSTGGYSKWDTLWSTHFLPMGGAGQSIRVKANLAGFEAYTPLTTLTGDVTNVGNAVSLIDRGIAPATYGGPNTVPSVAVNNKGLITNISNTTIQLPESQVTNLVADLASKANATQLSIISTNATSGSGAQRFITTASARITISLPSTSAVNDVIYVVGSGAGGWQIGQSAGQTIHGNIDTTTGSTGYIQSQNRYNCIELRCITANTDWVIVNANGTLTYN